MRKTARLMALTAALLGTSAVVTEASAALNGTLYAVVAPLYDGSTGSSSFIRLYGGTASANSTFTIRIVNSTTGANMGNMITIPVPKYSSPQFSFDTLIAMAGTAKTSDHNYSLYIQNAEPTAGYQHVTYNATSGLFENNSNCSNTLNQVVKAANPSLVLTNLHTTQINPSVYPMQIEIHNYWNAAVTYGVYGYDAGTADNAGTIRAGSGAAIGSKTYTVPANSTLSMSNAKLQQDFNFTPNSSQLHMNIIVTEIGGQQPAEVLTAVVVNNNSALAGTTNMSFACSVNDPPLPSTGGGGTIGGGDSGAYLGGDVPTPKAPQGQP